MRTPEFRFSVHPDWSNAHRLSLGISRVDGTPPRDRLGEAMHTGGITIDEMLAELRTLLGRLKAVDEPDGPASLPVVDGRVVRPEAS